MNQNKNILQVNVDSCDEASLSQITHEYFLDQSMRMIYFVDAATCVKNVSNQKLHEALEMADMRVASDKELQKQTGYRINAVTYFEAVADIVLHQGLEVVILTRSEREAEEGNRILRKRYPYMNLKILSVEASGNSYDILANEINSLAPDLLMIGIDAEEQGNLVYEYRGKINAKVCVCLGETLDDVMDSNREIPGFIQKLHMECFYLWIKRRNKLHTIIARIQLRKMLRAEKSKK